MSMDTWPKTCFLASATNALPGPTILSTLGIVSVPYARAAIAWAPPTLNILSMPAILAAVSMAGLTLPLRPGGVTITTSGTPAIFAGIESMSTVEGYAAVPPGTYRPALSTGVIFCPMTVPSSPFISKPVRTCFSWKRLMFAAAFSSTSMNSLSMLQTASSISSCDTARESRATLSNLSVYSFRALSPFSLTFLIISPTIGATSEEASDLANISLFATSLYFIILIIDL